MRVLLVKPASKQCQAAPPLGLMYISSLLKTRYSDVGVRIIDLRLVRDAYKRYSKEIKEWKPDVIGITVMSGDIPDVERLTACAKVALPEIHVCCGGPHPTHMPEDFDTLRNVDSIVSGEGEYSFLRLIEILTNGGIRKCGSEKGISIRGEDGMLRFAGKSDPIKDLDSLPFPDWDTIDIKRYSKLPQFNGIIAGRRYMPVLTSRGCPFQCIFCHNIFGKSVRLRSAENVVEEITRLAKGYQVDEIQVFDDIFNINRERLIKICDLIIEKNLDIKISFPNGVRADLLDEEMIKKLKQAGTYSLTFAIETTSERLQRMIKKNLNIERARQAIIISRRYGVINSGFFMIGFPTETVGEMKTTIDFAMKLPIDIVSISTVIPFKGTDLYRIACDDIGKEKLDTLSNHYFGASRESYYFLSTGYNIQRLQRNAYIRFYLNPIRLIIRLYRIPRKISYMRQFAAHIRDHIHFHLNHRHWRFKLAGLTILK